MGRKTRFKKTLDVRLNDKNSVKSSSHQIEVGRLNWLSKANRQSRITRGISRSFKSAWARMVVSFRMTLTTILRVL